MTTLVRDLTQPLSLTLTARAAGDAAAREFEGIGVPYNQVIDLGWGYLEAFDPGSIELHEQGCLVLWQHNRHQPIGLVTAVTDTDDGWHVAGRLSEVAQAAEAYTLLRDGVITRLSIGFEPREYRVDEDGVTHWTKVIVREVSLVTFPAYDGAQITDVRHQPPHTTTTHQEDRTMTDDLSAQLATLTGTVTDLSRALDQLRAGHHHPTPPPQFRSFGEYVKAAASTAADDQANAAAFMRAWTGATFGDGVDVPNWLGMLHQDMTAKQPITNLFTYSHDLPAKGNTLEYGFVKEDTTQVTKQAAEGDTLAFGKVELDTANASIDTYGGWSSLSQKAIDRAPVSLLDLTWSALARRYARTIEAVTRTIAAAAITAAEATPTVTVAAELDALTVDAWIGIVLDLVEAADESDWPLDGLLLSKTVFRSLAALGESKKALQISAAPTDKIGTLALPKASGEMLHLPFVMFPGQAGKHISGFASSALVVQESAGAPLRLQDSDVTNLTGAFSVYGYAAHYVTGPSAFRAVKKA
jgi:HK97 family phage prohead protease